MTSAELAVGLPERRVDVIVPSGRSGIGAAFRELWRYRDLVLILARRDVAVRYKQAVFGFAWAIVQPLVLVAAFALFLHRTGQTSGHVPYPVFALAGLVPWTFVSSAVLAGSQSLVESSNLVSKVYFPRLALPVAALLSWLPDLAVATAVLAIMMAAYGVAPGLSLLAWPAALGCAVLAAGGVTVWGASLNVAYRDVKYAMPFAVQLWLFASPVIYTARHFSGASSVLIGLNPATGVVEVFRWAMFGYAPSLRVVATSMLVAVALLASGLRYFRRTERYFADVI